jgi:hypothetical protein
VFEVIHARTQGWSTPIPQRSSQLVRKTSFAGGRVPINSNPKTPGRQCGDRVGELIDQRNPRWRPGQGQRLPPRRYRLIRRNWKHGIHEMTIAHESFAMAIIPLAIRLIIFVLAWIWAKVDCFLRRKHVANCKGRIQMRTLEHQTIYRLLPRRVSNNSQRGRPVQANRVLHLGRGQPHIDAR